MYSDDIVPDGEALTIFVGGIVSDICKCFADTPLSVDDLGRCGVRQKQMQEQGLAVGWSCHSMRSIVIDSNLRLVLSVN